MNTTMNVSTVEGYTWLTDCGGTSEAPMGRGTIPQSTVKTANGIRCRDQQCEVGPRTTEQ